jgi:hypothetical protein
VSLRATETGSRRMGARGWGGMGVSVEWTDLQFWGMESSGDGWWGQSHSHVSMLNAATLCTSAWLRFYVRHIC